MLAVGCRAENNRYYLNRGVELRPGYLAKWVEFTQIDSMTAVEQIQARHRVNTKNSKALAEADHMSKLDGINRDFNVQTILLRIKIEKATKNKKDLSDVEVQQIVNCQLKTKYDRLAAEARREGRSAARAANPNQDDDEDSEETDEEGWNDPNYVEEQRKALQEFSKLKKEAKKDLGKSKKKKKKKNKGGQALNNDDASDFGDGASYYSKNEE